MLSKYFLFATFGLALSSCSSCSTDATLTEDIGIDTSTAVVADDAPVNVTIALDSDSLFQTITGWEVTGRVWQFDKANNRFDNSWEIHSDQIFDTLVNELGLNRFRLEALSGLENPVDNWSRFTSHEIGYREFRNHYYEKINDNDDPLVANLSNYQFGHIDYVVEKMLLPMKQKIEANGEKLFINLNYVDFKSTDLRGNLEHAKSPEEYAEFILVCFDHLKNKYNLVPDSMELILEPENTLFWNGTNIGLGLLAVKSRLNAAGYFPEFIGPSTTRASQATRYFDEMVKVPGVGDALSVLSYHRYDSGITPSLLSNIASTAQSWNLRTEMLEHVAADSDELLDDLIYGNVSAWQQYAIATNITNKGAYYLTVDNSSTASPDIALDFRAAGLSLIFKHVRAGAVRIGAVADNSSITPVAFVNTNQSHVVTLRNNTNQTVGINGLPTGSYSVVNATKSGSITRLGTHEYSGNGSFKINLPAGLTTIHADNLTSSAAPDTSSSTTTSELPIMEPAGNSDSGVVIIEPMINPEPTTPEPIITPDPESIVRDPVIIPNPDPIDLEPVIIPDPEIVTQPVVVDVDEAAQPASRLTVDIEEFSVSVPQTSFENTTAGSDTPEPITSGADSGTEPVTLASDTAFQEAVNSRISAAGLSWVGIMFLLATGFVRRKLHRARDALTAANGSQHRPSA